MNLQYPEVFGFDAASNSHVDEFHHSRRAVRAELRKTKVTVTVWSCVDVTIQAANLKTSLRARSSTAVASGKGERVVVAQQLLVALNRTKQILRGFNEEKALARDLRAFRNTSCHSEMLINAERINKAPTLLEVRAKK